MAGFMEGYGVKEARRSRLILRIALSVLIVAIVGTAGYFYFRTWSEEPRSVALGFTICVGPACCWSRP